jgi:hypothetical protein
MKTPPKSTFKGSCLSVVALIAVLLVQGCQSTSKPEPTIPMACCTLIDEIACEDAEVSMLRPAILRRDILFPSLVERLKDPVLVEETQMFEGEIFNDPKRCCTESFNVPNNSVWSDGDKCTFNESGKILVSPDNLGRYHETFRGIKKYDNESIRIMGVTPMPESQIKGKKGKKVRTNVKPKPKKSKDNQEERNEKVRTKPKKEKDPFLSDLSSTLRERSERNKVLSNNNQNIDLEDRTPKNKKKGKRSKDTDVDPKKKRDPSNIPSGCSIDFCTGFITKGNSGGNLNRMMYCQAACAHSWKPRKCKVEELAGNCRDDCLRRIDDVNQVQIAYENGSSSMTPLKFVEEINERGLWYAQDAWDKTKVLSESTSEQEVPESENIMSAMRSLVC